MLCIHRNPPTISLSVTRRAHPIPDAAAPDPQPANHPPDAIAPRSGLPSPAPDPLGNRLLVLFDGHCALCHASVRWLLRRDRYDRLRFTPSHSPAAQTLPATTNLNTGKPETTPNTILVLNPATNGQPRILTRSTAVLACLAQLPAPWPQLASLAGHIPLPLRDTAYRLIAHLRYRLARRYTTCPLPTPNDRPHFL